MACRGCGEHFDVGEQMVRGGDGMVHAEGRCFEIAERRVLDAEAAARSSAQQRLTDALSRIATDGSDGFSPLFVLLHM